MTLFVLVASLACAGGPPGVPSPVPRVLVRIVADTLEMTATWSNPADDGQGPLDSIKVRLVGIFSDSSVVYTPPFPVRRTLKTIIPPVAYQPGGSATYDLWAEVTTYRNGLTAGPVQSSKVRITLVGAVPLPVTGLTFTAVKRP